MWWGEQLEQGILKHTFFPVLKYPKVKGTKKSDLTKSPSISAKVPYYERDGRWNVEIYDVNRNLLFPCENEELTPAHFVPKLSNVACVIQCGGIWIGGKGWGLTWKLVQCVVKPKEVASVFGTCHINLSEEDRSAIVNDSEPAEDIDDIPAPIKVETKVSTKVEAPKAAASASIVKKVVAPPVVQAAAVQAAQVEDSDEEEEPEPEPEPKVVDVPKVVEAPSAPAAPAEPKKVIKKVIAKK